MRAIWIPAQTSHAIEVREVTAMRTLYIAPAQAASLSRSCLAIEVSPLLRELILHIVARGMLGAVKSQDSHLTALLLDLIACSEATPLGLPLPNDRRARRLAERIIDDPENVLPLVDLAGESGASLRTLQRLFAAETGMSIEAWRARARTPARTGPAHQRRIGNRYRAADRLFQPQRVHLGIQNVISLPRPRATGSIAQERDQTRRVPTIAAAGLDLRIELID